ncbi:uncharacterized protein LOC118649963 isoform X1 [Myotis myotis]|uniref:uncharacterized protein LOC118649963 isoform X1 n=1 Tax=Myotis myotis TaxID=51298 RepID=UPI00174B3570|nr:uncharacterized protein LOC118649963 isoform X1 [Myotis myotis]
MGMRGGGTLRRGRHANVIGRPRPTPANQEARCSPHPKNLPHPPQSPLRDPGKRLKWRWPRLRSRGVRTVKNLNPITAAVSLEAIITINRCRADCRSGWKIVFSKMAAPIYATSHMLFLQCDTLVLTVWGTSTISSSFYYPAWSQSLVVNSMELEDRRPGLNSESTSYYHCGTGIAT